MSDKKTEQKGADQNLGNLTFEQLAKLAEIFKRDDDAIAAKAQKEAEAKEMAATSAETRAAKQQICNSCDHRRVFGQQAIWNIAWAPYADDIPRGTCKTCGDEFTPDHPRYKEMLTNGSTAGYYLMYHR